MLRVVVEEHMIMISHAQTRGAGRSQGKALSMGVRTSKTHTPHWRGRNATIAASSAFLASPPTHPAMVTPLRPHAKSPGRACVSFDVVRTVGGEVRALTCGRCQSRCNTPRARPLLRARRMSQSLLLRWRRPCWQITQHQSVTQHSSPLFFCKAAVSHSSLQQSRPGKYVRILHTSA